MSTVGVIGTLDTKGRELEYLCERVRVHGSETLLIDCGTGSAAAYYPDIPAEMVAEAGDGSLADLRARGDRGEAIEVMARGAAVVAAQLYAERRIEGLVSLGGSAGTTIGSSAMRSLPIGVPKLMVSTMASGDVGPYVDIKDICMMYSVVDIAGINRLSRRILNNAAAGITGMVQARRDDEGEDRPLIGATMFGVTTPCVTRARELLEDAGYEVLTFHATGSGGRAMEDLVRGGFLVGVLDITTTELADELVGGVLSAGPKRLEAAGEVGLPQVVCPGAIDMVNFGPRETVPARIHGRLFYRHNPTVTLMRTSPEENAELGCLTARKLNASIGPTAVILPRQGVSAIDRVGQPFYSAEAYAAYRDALRNALGANVNLIEVDAHINDPEFAEFVVSNLLQMLVSGMPPGR